MIHIHKAKNGQYYFTVTAKNNKVLVTSETYKNKRNLKIGIGALEYAMGTRLYCSPEVIDHTIKPKRGSQG